MDIQIRKANLEDLGKIDILECSLEHRILSYEILKNTLDKNTYYYFVATVNNIVVGYIVAELMVDHFDLLSIAVSKEYRRQHVASMLLNKLFSTCKELNIIDIFLEVRCNNFAAIDFYEKNCFKRISTRKNYYEDTNEDAFIYLKKLV